MVCSALVQEGVSRAISSVLGKREEKASQGHIMERLEMAVNDLEFALERSAKLPITDVSLLDRRKVIRCSYVEAAKLLDNHKQQAVQGQEGLMKRKLWMVRSKNPSVSSFVDLSTDAVRRFEWYADCAHKFVRDVESGCSLRHYTFCNPLVRHLLEGKTLCYSSMEKGNLRRYFYIWPMCSKDRGVEANLGCLYEDGTVAEKSFFIMLLIRLSESTDIAGVAIECLRLLTSQFKLETERAVGELSRVIQDVSHSYEFPWVGIQELHVKLSRRCRLEPACCKASRHGLCADNVSSSSELLRIFPEQVIFVYFKCYISALEAGGGVSRGRRSPLEVRVGIKPHYVEVKGDEERGCYAEEILGNNHEVRDVSIQQVAETHMESRCAQNQKEVQYP
ncbi:unnamed protein product [Urochloa decumbens]|uniref:Uncharacterized protein n=1 Tax=Urochloa decumbens TaxID=240449 RepID=A0ABC9GS23_9POAL